MFGKDEPVEVSAPGIHSLLGPGSHFKGEIRAAGVIRIDAGFEGAVESTARVMIGPAAVVDADIRARHVVVAGRVRGSITATERLELHSGSHVEADLQTARLTISEGAHFQGRCDMSERVGAPAGKDARPAAETTPLRVLG